MTWIRIVVYKGNSVWIEEQRAKSLPEGTRSFSYTTKYGHSSITTRTLCGTGFWARIREIVRILRTTK